MKNKYGPKHRPADVYKFILDFKEANDGISPTLDEIGQACDITSKSVVKYILDRLADQGKIYLANNAKTRMIKVVGGRWMPPGRVS